MQVSKKWRVWLGFCAAVTAPFLLRDLYQVATNPPVLNAPLASSKPVQADPRDVAVLPGKFTVNLTEVRSAVAGGYAGRPPRSATLPEAAPDSGVWTDGNDQYWQILPAGKQAYRFAAKMQGLPGDILRLAIESAPDISPGGAATLTGWDTDGDGYVTSWLLLPQEDRTADVYAGAAIRGDRRILAQFPLPGKAGIAYGAKAVWMPGADRWTRPIAIAIPTERRPRTAGQYFQEVFELDALGNASLYDQRIVKVTPTTDRLKVDLHGPLRKGGRTCALRVTLTPFRWAKFADVPLAAPDADTARLTPFPIAPYVEQARQDVTGSSSDAAFYEVVYAKREQLSHPQVARYVPDSVVISHTRYKDGPDHTNAPPAPNVSYLHVYLPRIWGQNKKQMKLTVTTRTGKQVQAVLDSSDYPADGKSLYTAWKVQGTPPEYMDAVLFGLKH